MKKISLGKSGKFVLVDDADFDELSKYSWCLNVRGYAHRVTPRPNRKWLQMHRQLLSNPIAMQVDHINGDRLDNRRINLRVCTLQQNRMNQAKQSRNTSGYKGVSLHKQSGLWVTKIRRRTVGYFKDITEAASAYNREAAIEFGEYARFNIIKETK